jgi:hypothetical protein
MSSGFQHLTLGKNTNLVATANDSIMLYGPSAVRQAPKVGWLLEGRIL